MKGVSEFVLILLVLIIAVISISVLWLFYHDYFNQITSSGETSALGETLSSCMKIDSVKNEKIYLKNCGSGLIKNNTLKLYFDEEPVSFSMNPASIGKGEIAEINITGLWKIGPGNHKIIFETKSGKVERYIKASVPDSCVLALDFDEGNGTIAYDSSGYGNNGKLNNFSIYNCSSVNEYSTITVGCPVGKYITSIENSVYISQSNPASCSNPSPGGYCNRYCDYVKNCIGKNSCSFTVSNANCGGDPCPGTNKKLILNVSCNYWVDGKFGKALQFDGKDDYISIPLSPSLNITGNQITVEAWIKPLGNSSTNYEWQHLIDNYDGYWLDILGLPTYPDGRGNFSFRVANTATTMFANGKTRAVRGNWYHVVGAVNTSHALIYVNGNLDGSVAFSGNLNASGSTYLLIGKYKDMLDPDFNFNGTIDSVRIFNKALTPDETVSLTLGELA